MSGVFERWGRFSVVALLFVVLIGIVLFLSEILLPFILACFLAYVLSPIIRRMHRWKIRNCPFPRGLAVICVYSIILSFLSAGGAYLVPNVSDELSQMLKEFPEALNENTKVWLPKIDEKLNQWMSLFPASVSAEEDIEDTAEPPQTEEVLPDDSLITVLELYTYEIRQLDSGSMEVIPRRRAKQLQNDDNHLDIREIIRSAIQVAASRLQENTVNFLNLGREILTSIAGSIFTLFLTLMVSAFILIDIDRIGRFWLSLMKPEHHERYDLRLPFQWLLLFFH